MLAQQWAICKYFVRMADYDGYNYKKFRELASNDALSVYEKIGFPVSYRKNSEGFIFEDILSKVPILREERHLNVLDIGPGCSFLQKSISSICKANGHTLFLADSPEMLRLTGDLPYVRKYAGFFPDETFEAIYADSGGIDVIICYSVFQYVFAEGNAWRFIDCILKLMNRSSQCIMGDIPNISKRKRFFASGTGVKFHKSFMHTNEIPKVFFNQPEFGRIDDAVLLSIIMRCQYFGFDAYIVPQDKRLPFANRRDDILIRRL